MADKAWSNTFPQESGDYYSRIDEYDRCPTLIRVENGAVYECGADGNMRREYEVEDWQYLPISPAQAEQFDALRKAAQQLIDNNAGPTSTESGVNSHVLVPRKDFVALMKALGKQR